MSETQMEYTAEYDRIKTLEAEVDALRSNLSSVRAELNLARKRVKWYSKLVARLCKADLEAKEIAYGKRGEVDRPGN